MLGTSIAHHQITAKLGQGDMGEVYRAPGIKLNDSTQLAHYVVSKDNNDRVIKKSQSSNEPPSIDIMAVENWFEEFREEKSTP